MTALAAPILRPRLLLPDGHQLVAETADQLWAPGSPLGILGGRIKTSLAASGFDLRGIEGVSNSFAGGLALPRKRRGVGVVFNLATAAGTKVLDHLNGKTSYTLVTPNYIGLASGATVASDSGSSVTAVEANYTGYLRLSMGATDYGASTTGAGPPTATSSAPVASKTWPNCTAGSTVVTNWFVVLGTSTARLNAGDITFYGSCTSTTINTTQTPPTVAANGFTFTDT